MDVVARFYIATLPGHALVDALIRCGLYYPTFRSTAVGNTCVIFPLRLPGAFVPTLPNATTPIRYGTTYIYFTLWLCLVVICSDLPLFLLLPPLPRWDLHYVAIPRLFPPLHNLYTATFPVALLLRWLDDLPLLLLFPTVLRSLHSACPVPHNVALHIPATVITRWLCPTTLCPVTVPTLPGCSAHVRLPRLPLPRCCCCVGRLVPHVGYIPRCSLPAV